MLVDLRKGGLWDRNRPLKPKTVKKMMTNCGNTAAMWTQNSKLILLTVRRDSSDAHLTTHCRIKGFRMLIFWLF